MLLIGGLPFSFVWRYAGGQLGSAAVVCQIRTEETALIPKAHASVAAPRAPWRRLA
jgi:hypothetical protein